MLKNQDPVYYLYLQHVKGPAHCRGNTLDLVITPSGCPLNDVDIEPAGRYSDHSLVVCSLPLTVESPSAVERLVRGWRRVDRKEVQRMLCESDLSRPQADDVDVDQLFSMYDTVLRNVADRLAPPIAVHRKPGCSTPWFDAECRAKRRECRMLERRYRRSRSTTDCHAWVNATRARFRLLRSKKEEYWLSRLETCSRSLTKIWKTMSPLLGRNRDVTSSTSHTADGFASFFARKIDRVRSDTEGLPPPPITDITSSSFTAFRTCSQEEVRKTVMSSPIKSCLLDPIPTFLLDVPSSSSLTYFFHSSPKW